MYVTFQYVKDLITD